MTTTMRVAYHPSCQTLSKAALDAWIAAALLDITAAPGVVVNLQRPNYPYPFKRSAVADNRKTRGGRGFSIFKHSARSGVWKFNDVPNAQISAWDALYDATKGLLHPFVVELPIAGVNAAIRAPGDYPLTPSKPMFWSGQMNMEEYIS